MQTNNTDSSTPLWKVLQKKLKDVTFRVNNYPEDKKRKGVEYRVLQKDAERLSKEYTTLAVNSLAILAEALGNAVKYLQDMGETEDMCDTLKEANEALKAIS